MSSSLFVLPQKRQQQHRIILLIIAVAAATFSFLLIPDEATHSFMTSRRRLGSLASLASEAQEHSSTVTTYTDLIRDNAPLPKYSLQSAIKAADMYSSRFSLLRYDPATDTFIGYYSKKHNWVSGCNKLVGSIDVLTTVLRRLFPERFTPDSPELVLAVSGGDYPAVNGIYSGCIHNDQDRPCDESLLNASPVLHFGSVFSNPMFPNMIGMPMFGRHLTCFQHWIMNGRRSCSMFSPTPETYALPWDELIPQLIWRGTDFSFLQIQNNLSRPSQWNLIKVLLNDSEEVDKKETLIRKLRENYHRMIPRWKGVLYTAESEAEAARSGSDALPKVNIKFSHVAEGGSHAARGAKEYMAWEEVDFPLAGEYLNGTQLAKYKYHIDLGGGGGTTWTGTVNKLGLPGLLFHHVTPTKDYIHDHIKPWVHYVPVRSDLEDLPEKLEWAESHPEDAKHISENATELMRKLSSSEGFEPLFQQYLLEPLQEVIEAYTPMNLRDEEAWIEQFEQLGGGSMKPFLECKSKCSFITAI